MFGVMAVPMLIFSTEKAEKYKHSTTLVCVPCRSCQASDILFSFAAPSGAIEINYWYVFA
jgi:hypothetical protein